MLFRCISHNVPVIGDNITQALAHASAMLLLLTEKKKKTEITVLEESFIATNL